MRRTVTMVGGMVMALLPAIAAVSINAATPEEIPVAITQPLARVTGTSTMTANQTPLLPDEGMMMLVGSGLLGLGTIVRKSTRM